MRLFFLLEKIIAICNEDYESSPLKVIVLHSGSLRGFPSGEYYVANSENEILKEKGVDVQFVQYTYGQLPSVAILSRVKTILGYLWSRRAYYYMLKLIRDNEPDVVHFHGIFPYLSASSLAAAHDSGVTVIQTLHNGRWLCLEGAFYRNSKYCDKCISYGRWNGVLHGCKHGIVASFFLYLANHLALSDGKLFKWVDRFIAVSEFIRDQHVRSGFTEDKIIVKNNGMDLGRIHNTPVSIKRSGIAYVSRISTAKGSEILKQLIPLISQDIHVVGDGPDLPSLKEFCDQSGYTHVKFWGKQPQDRCFEIMASVICSVVPSQCGEAFPLVACESMALGTPVVGSDLGGLGPLLVKSGGGIAVPATNIEVFFSAVQSLIDSPSEANRLGKVARKYVESNLDSQINVEQLMEIYQSVLDEKQNAARI
jgi:glycosyltransferase involved in cell wall biosynthesis